MAATTQVRLLVWSCRYAAEIRGKVDRVPADRRRCLVVVTDAHSRLEAQTRDAAARPGTDGIVIMPSGSGRSSTFRVPWTPDSHHCVTCILARDLRPHRLVVRTSRCGRDNPGSNPGVDTCPKLVCQGTRCTCVVTIMAGVSRVFTTTANSSACFHQNDKNDRPHGAK